MNSSTVDSRSATASDVAIDDDVLSVQLTDGRRIVVPLAWYPRLVHGTRAEREHWRLMGNGCGINWPDLDEDISVENLLRGVPSGESQPSFKKWLAQRPDNSAKS